MKKLLFIIAMIFGLSQGEYLFKTKSIQIDEYIEQAKTLNLSNITCGFHHCYALKDGVVYSVGYNPHGQLGLGDTTNRSTWTSTGFTADSVVGGIMVMH